MFRRVLIANRGEIACRVIATCRRLGIHTIAVFSEADRRARHVRLADEAHLIGPAPASETYLDIGRVIEVARSQRRRRDPSGLRLPVGERRLRRGLRRSRHRVHRAGRRRRSAAWGEARGQVAGGGRRRARACPATTATTRTPATLAREADEIGFPLLVKAVAGGGGKGMRVVRSTAELADAVAAAGREAATSFGDGRILLERFVERPRHIEVQVFGDTHGNCLHLFERDCSIQRRHQKIIEEAPVAGRDAPPCAAHERRRGPGGRRRSATSTPAPSSSSSARTAISTSWR